MEKKFHQLLSAAVSHELRNPLSSLLCNILALQNKGVDMRRIVQSLKNAVEKNDKERLKYLIESLSEILDFYDFSLKRI